MLKRRQFLMTAAAAGGLSALAPPGLGTRPAQAATPRGLTIATRNLDINGRSAKVFSLTDDAGRAGLVLEPGTPFDVRLANSLSEETIVHWHGLTPPFEQDGVPNNPLPALAAGESRSYNFKIAKPGTFWMHAHTLQEQNLLAAPLIVHSSEDLTADWQEVVVMLHDFSFTPAEELLANLTGGQAMGHGAMHGMNHDMPGMGQTGNMGGTMSGMMGGMDLNDIAYDAFLANDRTLDDPELVQVEKGGKVLLRIINGASSTAFTISTGTLTATLRAVDGRPVEPVTGTMFPLTMAQRIDLMVDVPKDGGSFPVLALREGAPEQTGLILATPGANVAKIALIGQTAGPVLDLDFEARLRTREALADRPADRSLMVHLVGDMMSYQWGMMGAEAISAKIGERIEISLMNMSMMSHPMHMHGHDFQVVGIDGKRFSGAVRDTVLVTPMRTVTIAVDIVNPGQWPFHCHHLYHMVSGMMVHMPVS
jgi:FtsP/CotA-like multicopper oxidase with cupredoxin domain